MRKNQKFKKGDKAQVLVNAPHGAELKKGEIVIIVNGDNPGNLAVKAIDRMDGYVQMVSGKHLDMVKLP